MPTEPQPLDDDRGLALRLAAHQLRSWTAHAGQQLKVLDGRVWVTESGQPDDHFLSAGDRLVLCGTGRVVVGCEGRAPALVWLRPAPQGVWARASRYAAAAISLLQGFRV